MLQAMIHLQIQKTWVGIQSTNISINWLLSLSKIFTSFNLDFSDKIVYKSFPHSLLWKAKSNILNKTTQRNKVSFNIMWVGSQVFGLHVIMILSKLFLPKCKHLGLFKTRVNRVKSDVKTEPPLQFWFSHALHEHKN